MIPSAAQSPPAAGGKLQPFTETLPGSVVKIQMLAVPGGAIKIGTKTVTVKPFWLARTETTWEAYDVFLASGPPSPAYDQTEFGPDAIARPSKSYILPDLGWGHNGYPVINASFTSVTMFCRWLADGAKKKYRLPTEAEWELACRAGVAGPWKMDKAAIEKSAWYAGNSARTTHPVAKKVPNKLGFFDMLGNAGEWASDLDGKPVLCGGTFLDPPAKIAPGTRRRQTPEWQETDPQFPKSRWWLSDGKFVGFRIACEP
jgi:formylglycine-generating enzyme required for sulfatase activity